MPEQITLITGSKEEVYESLLPQIEALMENESDLIACLGNVAAVLKNAFRHLWIGFYLVKSESELVLGPFQGSLACTRIKKGKGVCGTAWEKAATQIIPDVNNFPNHICCDVRSRSEIVVPLIKNGEVWGVLDVDSDELDRFDETDRKYLEKLCNEILSAKEYR
ncbi:MAG: GAF domain-containing protein [Mediterranea sp.]|jgi:GAF domain-containing protein|nr:GAF domain-containing protein [Mediterranea sp.]